MKIAGNRLSTVCVLLLLLFLLTACTTLGNLAHANPTHLPGSGTANASQKVSLDLGIPQAAFQYADETTLPDTTAMHAIVTFKLNTTLMQQLAAQHTSKAGQSINLTTLPDQLGINNQLYQQMQTFFGGPGITLHLNSLHTNMVIDAKAGVLATHLKTQFMNFSYNALYFYAPDPPVQLPRVLADHIQAIIGLDSYSKYQNDQAPVVSKLAQHVQVNQNGCVADAYDFTSAQIAQAYGFNGLYNHGWLGQGTTIILPEFGSFSQSDVQHYLDCEQFGGTLKVVNVDNTPPTDDGDGEALLDIEMAAGMAPDANIVVYQTDAGKDYDNFWPKLLDVFNQISNDYSTHQQPVEISLSWGDAEDQLASSVLTSVDTALQTITSVEHINFFAASGDCGAYTSADYPNTLDVSFPASDPSAVGVGGTILHIDSQGNRIKEAVWQENPQRIPDCENTWGSGGGLSDFFPRPAWQQNYTGIQNKYSNGERQVPDVSAAAYYLAVYEQGEWDYSGGTSAATPIWASAYALLNQGLVKQTGYYVSGNSLLYTLATRYSKDNPYYDVQDGNNLYYSATPGWDYATGLGTPNLAGIYNGLTAYVQKTS
jgi:kumamolisin